MLTLASTTDPEGFLAHPVNAYKLMKRLNTEWSELESLVLKDSSEGKRLLFSWLELEQEGSFTLI